MEGGAILKNPTVFRGRVVGKEVMNNIMVVVNKTHKHSGNIYKYIFQVSPKMK